MTFEYPGATPGLAGDCRRLHDLLGERNLFESLHMLTRAVDLLARRCVRGISANEERCRELPDGSIDVLTSLDGQVVYEQAPRLAQMALASDRSVAGLAVPEGLLEQADVAELLAPEVMLNRQ